MSEVKWFDIKKCAPVNEHKEYLITIDDDKPNIPWVTAAWWDSERKQFYECANKDCADQSELFYFDSDVTAWAFMPKPFGKWIGCEQEGDSE